MAGQYKTQFLTKISKKTFQSSTFPSHTSRSSNNHFSNSKFILLSLLVLTMHIHCTAAGPLQRIPNSTELQDDSSAQLNKVVDIPKINSQLGLFQGDIKLSRIQQSIYQVITTRKFYPQTPLPERMIHYWDYGLIYYDTSSISDARLLSLIELAISSLKTETNCLIFLRADHSTTDYIKFTDNDGCWSFLGRQGGPQEIALGASSCQYRNIIIHLIFHALGFVHEESRPDRDRNVEIDFNNVAAGRETNFDILPEELARTNGTNYNYNSIMHSLKKASSVLTRDGYKQTIRPLLTLGGANFGTISSLTPVDVTRVKALYCPYSVNRGDWTQWSVWSSCSVSCNSGTKYRTRICYKPDSSYVCEGSGYEVARCHKYACIGQVRAHWSSWGQWSRCSASCGGGAQVRVRQCLGGDVCTRGKGRQYRTCGIYRCPGSRWNSWSQWSPCSQSCHYGKTTRTRQCNGADCSGPNRQTQICNYKIPCAPVWEPWSAWSTCTSGLVTRTRSCRLPPYKCRGPHTEHLACATEGQVTTDGVSSTGELVPTDTWSSWSPCSSSCGPGEQTRSNSCGQIGECRQVRRCQITTRCSQET